MIQPFDSYTKDGKVVIITTEFDPDGEMIVVSNFMPIHRAEEIFMRLKDTIKKAKAETNKSRRLYKSLIS